MRFKQLIALIKQTNQGLQKKAISSINQLLVIRNWLIGFYIVEFEQNGDDRAKYGQRLLKTIAEELEKKKLKGLSFTNLKLFRLFYLTYPQIGQPVADQLKVQNIMEAGDNPPVGIILCTDKEETKVEYATAGLDNQLFVSKYLVELPSKEDFIKLLET